MASFDLIDEPWIPCVDLGGRSLECGLRETLLRAHELREICDDSPLVTVAIHRLLLAVLYRSYEGPRDFCAWVDLYAKGAFSPDRAAGYLDRWRDRFDLFGNDRPFYQVGGLQMKDLSPVTRLATETANGNNPTLFDHSLDEEAAGWSPSQSARWLVACQAFALGFGKSGRFMIDGSDEAPPYSADAIALRGMNVWLQGDNLFATLAINLVPIDDQSVPPWELEDPHEHRDRVSGGGRKAVASFGVIDRFTWQSRLVRLIPEDGRCSWMYFSQGRSADKSAGDPMKVYRSSAEEGVSPVSLSGSKAAWRELHAIFMIPVGGSSEQRPECFNLVARARRQTTLLRPDAQMSASVVGLASAPNKAGKFVLWRHERLPVPPAVLGDCNLIERLGEQLRAAEQAAVNLSVRARRVAKLYLAPESESPDGRQPDKEEVTRVAGALDPRPAFWARLEEHFFALLLHLPDDWDTAADGWKPDDQQMATNAWRDHVNSEARRALEESVRSLGTTARAIQAVARVHTGFHDSDLKPPSKNEPKTKRGGGGQK